MDTLLIKAEERKDYGRKVKKLRRAGFIPANIYGKKIKSKSITLDFKEFLKIFKEAGETKIVEVSLESEKLPTLIHNVQTDPVDGKILHVDLLQVDLKQKVTTSVPLEYEGESPAEKQGIGTVVKYVDEVEIEALPANIPDKFVIDLSILQNVNDQIKILDLNVDTSKIEITDDPEKIIAKVEELRAEEEPQTSDIEETQESEDAAADTTPQTETALEDSDAK